MADYRRWFVPGGTYFFTLVTAHRAPLFLDPFARNLLGDQLRKCQANRPFEINALVLLPEHLHAIWTLPPGDNAYPARWAWIKKEFTKAWLAAGGTEQAMGAARTKRGDRGVWQPRYWEHTIADEHDFDRHFDYVHYNPVKHEHVSCPADWKDSSFHRWVTKGVYEPDWACSDRGVFTFDDLNQTAMEMGLK
ncbi:MAG TPA: transposase [Planctomycetaceae bacterium]|nr:transposase [Planctomycetaceae bacterium]